MGQAKQRAKQREAFLGGLNEDQLMIANVAIGLCEFFVRPEKNYGLCYWLAFFMHTYLKDTAGISVQPVVGFVWDRQTPLMASHAWIEFGGRKTDVSLCVTERPDVQPPGQVLIHDFVYGQGYRYDYLIDRPASAIAAVAELRNDPNLRGMVEHKEMEHLRFDAIAGSPELAIRYLADAPEELSYSLISQRLSDHLGIG